MSPDRLIRTIRELQGPQSPLPLHQPRFWGNEERYVIDTIRSTFVSSVGPMVDRFERELASYIGSSGSVATVNGTAALHVALLLAGVTPGDRVLTQSLTFVATCNAIHYVGAAPVFIDVDMETLGLSPAAVAVWLEENAFVDDAGICRMQFGGHRISACVPMHTFGHPVRITELVELCERWRLPLVEDAAESLGSLYKDRHTGTFGCAAAFSFNGNKILTAGGGGLIACNETLAIQGKHLTTTAKVPHPYQFSHDAIGFNYRMPNLNAALACAQLEQLSSFVEAKRLLASEYAEAFTGSELVSFKEPEGCRSNYWLNAVVCPDRASRDRLLEETNRVGILTRPAWTLMHRLPMYADTPRATLANAEWLADRLLNLPSSVPDHARNS